MSVIGTYNPRTDCKINVPSYGSTFSARLIDDKILA